MLAPVRRHLPVALLAVVALVIAGCSSADTAAPSSTIPTELAAELEGVTAIAALGDSVPYGSACRCTPDPDLTGNDIAHAAGHPVDTANEAVPGSLSGDVLAQLENDAKVIKHVEDSQAVLVEVGANDVAYSSACGNDVACYDQKLPQLISNLDAIVARIHALTAGHRVAIVLLDYWSVWLGGQYAAAQGAAYVDAASAVTTSVNDAIQSAAGSSGSIYVDVRAAFRGPDDTWDETHLLARDGDHPNAAGHKRIAEALAQAVIASQ